MRSKPLVLWALSMAAILLVGSLAQAHEHEASSPSRPAAAIVTPSSTISAAPREPLAFRYQGELCSTQGCLLTTVASLCKATGVDSLLVDVAAVPGTNDAQATLVAVPSPARSWTQTTVLDLAQKPFRPNRVWAWPGSLPAWNNWCSRVGS